MPQESASTEKDRLLRQAFRQMLPDLPEAACKGEDALLWFGPHVCGVQCDGLLGCMEGKSETGRFRRIQEAKAVCHTCPVEQECGDWAISTDQPFGVWGGMTERERKKIRSKKRG
jgi:hypothetical protein